MNDTPEVPELLFHDREAVIAVLNEMSQIMDHAADHGIHRHVSLKECTQSSEQMRQTIMGGELPRLDCKKLIGIYFDHMWETISAMTSILQAAGLEQQRTVFDRQAFAAMLFEKHRLYGMRSITRWRHIGFWTRIDQKWARVAQLIEVIRQSGSHPTTDESIVDTLWDVVGYCVLGVLLARREEQENNAA
jgi:hypothetical protein